MTPPNNKRTHADLVLQDRELFQCLADRKTPKKAVSASIALHAVVLFALLLVPLIAPHTLNLNYNTTLLAPPQEREEPREPLQLNPPPPPAPRPITPREELALETPPVPAPKPAPPPPEVRMAEAVPRPVPPFAPPSVTPSSASPKPVPAPELPKPPIVTDVFSSATTNTAAAPARNTEVAGFGDAAANRGAARTVNSEGTAVAGFGSVSGSSGRGRPGATAGAGTVGGFESRAQGTGRSGTDQSTVAAAGFASPAEAPRTAPSSPKAEPKNENPVEITFKPRPDYTDEARKMRVEGEVLLRMLFMSSGEVRVLEVLRGLGYGLNENAIRAAEQIRFKPAERGGQPIDSTATVHIVFQLAY